MYLNYFGISKLPFGITPDTSLFFDGAERGTVLDAMLYALNAGEGIIKVVGEVGSGKTMLSRMLTKKVPDNVVLVFLLNPSIQAEQVLYAIAYDLGLQVASNEPSAHILHLLQKKLFELYQQNKKVVLVIDEAQQMPLATLEEIRLLSNLETETEKLLQIILFGQPELDQHIDTPKIRQLRERIAYSFYLSPLTWQVADEYLQFRLAKAGHQGRAIFKPSAIKLLSKYSDGTLRRLNMLADKSLLAAFLDKKPVVEPKHVRTALRDNTKGHPKKRSHINLSLIVLISLLAGVIIFYGVALYKPALPPPSTPTIAPQNNTLLETSNPAQPPVQKTSTVKENNVTSLLEQRINAFEPWHKESDNRFTIRLLTAIGNDEGAKSVEKFLREVKQLADIKATYVTNLDTKQQHYVAYYGSFSAFSEASNALSALPESLKKSSPYISLIPK